MGIRPIRPSDRTHLPPLSIEPFYGARSQLLPLFALADDSPSEIARYLHLGEILLASRASQILGHVQLIPHCPDWEIKSLAVAPHHQGCGVGAALIRAALDRAFSQAAARVTLATATADIDNLRFYQRLGFRMDRIERDAFSPDRGYPALHPDDIPLRDRVWFSITSAERR